jgi:hypothetical protein
VFSSLDGADDDFCQYALNFFVESGHADSSAPVFDNHTSEQFVFFDNRSDYSLSDNELSLLKVFQNIAYLFSLGDNVFEKRSGKQVNFYSIELNCSKGSRSQAAFEIHEMLHPLINAYASVILFRWENYVMLSIICENSECILSDWYEAVDDYDCLVEKMHIANVSLQSARLYIEDLEYNVAREYYIYPVHREMIIYTALPIDCFTAEWDSFVDRDEIQQYAYDELNKYINKYGDDYVDQEDVQTGNSDVGKELDMLLLEMDSIDEQSDDMLLEESDDEEFEEDEDISEGDSELQNIDPDVLNDPVLMVKWLQKNNQQ